MSAEQMSFEEFRRQEEGNLSEEEKEVLRNRTFGVEFTVQESNCIDHVIREYVDAQSAIAALAVRVLGEEADEVVSLKTRLAEIYAILNQAGRKINKALLDAGYISQEEWNLAELEHDAFSAL